MPKATRLDEEIKATKQNNLRTARPKQVQEVTYRWGWDEDTNEPIMLTLEEYVRRIAPLIVGPVASIQALDFDMLMSDYQKLTDASWKIKSLLKMLDENKQA